jgi:adenylosuccinate lyase
MLKRYTLVPMRELWSEERKFAAWLKVELAVLGQRLHEALCADITHAAEIDVARIEELEAEFEHDMIAFVVSVQEKLEAAGLGHVKGEFHKGLTSYDIEDPAMMLTLREANRLIVEKLTKLSCALRKKALEHQWTLMIARTHGQYAEPSTFGHLLLVYALAVERSIRRLNYIEETELQEGKISGAVGTYAGMDPTLEEKALARLGLRPAIAETQILQRDRHATLLNALAVAAGTIEQMCRTFWVMMRSDVGELEEPRKAKQRGSSAMAHKKNPILTERLIGMARLLRGDALAGMENIATLEWREISQSSVERHIFPDATSLLHYMAGKAAYLVENLIVFPERMRENLEKTNGIWATQPVRLALINAGVEPNAAYEYLQRAAFASRESERPLLVFLKKLPMSQEDPRTALEILGRDRLEACLDAEAYIKDGIEHIFSRAFSE